MSSKNRIAKPIEKLLLALDDHMYLLRLHLQKLREDKSHLKVIAAELRTLVCNSSGTEGLLWRLTDKFRVADLVAIHLPGKLKQDHPLARGLEIAIVPISRAGKGDPRLVPGNYSLRYVIEEAEALVAVGKPVTHEYLIKAVAQQMGTAHEDDGLEPALAQLSTILFNGMEPYLGVLAMDAELALEVGERVLEAAESRNQLRRGSHSHNYGNVSVVVRVTRKKDLDSGVRLFRLHSYTTEAAVVGFATPTGVLFQLSKRQQLITELLAPYPKSSALGADAIAVLSYSSKTGLARTITGDGATAPVRCKLGWVYASEFALEERSDSHKDFVDVPLLLIYERLLSSRDALDLLALPPNGYGLWKPADELQAQGVFPQ